MKEKGKEKENQNNIRGNDLIFTLREGFIFAINKLSRIRISNSERPIAKTGHPISFDDFSVLDYYYFLNLFRNVPMVKFIVSLFSSHLVFNSVNILP